MNEPIYTGFISKVYIYQNASQLRESNIIDSCNRVETIVKFIADNDNLFDCKGSSIDKSE